VSGEKIERVEKLSTIFLALLGAVAFFWQVVEHSAEKKERLALEIASEIPISLTNPAVVNYSKTQPFARLAWLALVSSSQEYVVVLTNTGERTVFLRAVTLSINTEDSVYVYRVKDDQGSPLKLEPGEIARFRARTGLRYTYFVITGARVEVRSTRNRHVFQDLHMRYEFVPDSMLHQE
jgi:hypothetical protein